MNERIPVPADGDPLPERLLSHLDAAYNLAHWLMRSHADAEDVVQEAYLRALQYSRGFRGGDSRAWLLTIVRNTSYRWLRRMRAYDPVEQFDEEVHRVAIETSNPEELALEGADARFVENALNQLPSRFREILVLREIEGCSYKEIAAVLGIPIGTVMSTLSRARERLRDAVGRLRVREESPEPGTVCFTR